MEDDTSSLDGKGLINMRVVDLKLELEKRGLSKSGSKKDLVKRLKQQLEFEKLCEERKAGDSHPKLELDAEIQQNEFVQQYLAQQQKRYAERQEEKRLELEAKKKCPGEDSAFSTKHQSNIDESASSDSDDKSNKKENLSNKSSESESESESSDDTNTTPLKTVESDTALCTFECESKPEITEKSSPPSHILVSAGDTEVKNSKNVELVEADGNQNTILNLSSTTEIEDRKESQSINISEIETTISRPTEHNKNTDNICISDDINDIKEQTHFETNIIDKPFGKMDSKVEEKIYSEKLIESDKHQSCSLFISEEVQEAVSHNVSPKSDSSNHLIKQKSSENMEVPDCSSVPYSLSDIQLPESPNHHVISKDPKSEDKDQSGHLSDEVTNENSLNKNKSNGETVHKLNSSQDDMSESETKDSSHSNDSPAKNKVTTRKRDSDESSDTESDRDNSSHKKKSFKDEDTSSNVVADSDNDHPKETSSNNKQKYIKTHRNTDESDDKSSDSEKYNRHVDSKRKSYIKSKKLGSRSSSCSSSKSSDSSPERRHSKKLVTRKSKTFIQDEESNHVSDKSSDEKSVKRKKNDHPKEPVAVASVSIKKRLKIKRDNVPIEIPSAAKEPLKTSTSNKTAEKPSNSRLLSDRPIKPESHERKEETHEITYTPRKVIPNYKLNRKSSEENNTEPKSMKNRWNKISSSQRFSSDLIGVTTNSVKNWFPEFKLITETTMEVEQDEHSLPAIDEKNDFSQVIPLNETNSGIKLESRSQMDIVEDSVSQEPNFDDNAELGPVSKIIFIQNLVRPFTLNQLKDLLKQNGKIVEEYFWIDKIKSKCFVMYETEKESIKARNALNNTRWPSSNPKILTVEFSNVEELEKHKKGNEAPPLKPPEPPLPEPSDALETRTLHVVEDHKRKDRERRKEKERIKLQAPIREWDKDKIVQDSPEREHSLKEEKPKSAEKKDRKESKKRATEDTPAKLLDDLFQKTKSVPCIYWLPLTEEQAKAKEEEKKMKRLEREKRNQQLKEQEEAERRNRRARSSSRRREKENRKSTTRSRSPVSRRR